MVKYFCDKCKEEIKGDIYRVNIYCDTKSKHYCDITTSIAIIQETPIEQPMFCEKCKDKIESFIFTGGYWL